MPERRYARALAIVAPHRNPLPLPGRLEMKTPMVISFSFTASRRRSRSVPFFRSIRHRHQKYNTRRYTPRLVYCDDSVTRALTTIPRSFRSVPFPPPRQRPRRIFTPPSFRFRVLILATRPGTGTSQRSSPSVPFVYVPPRNICRPFRPHLPPTPWRKRRTMPRG